MAVVVCCTGYEYDEHGEERRRVTDCEKHEAKK